MLTVATWNQRRSRNATQRERKLHTSCRLSVRLLVSSEVVRSFGSHKAKIALIIAHSLSRELTRDTILLSLQRDKSQVSVSFLFSWSNFIVESKVEIVKLLIRFFFFLINRWQASFLTITWAAEVTRKCQFYSSHIPTGVVSPAYYQTNIVAAAINLI